MAMKKIRRVLHPTDFSAASSGAFKRAVDFAKTSGAELLLVHVLPWVVPMMTDGYVSPKVYEDLETAARADGQKRLDRLVHRAREGGARVKGLLLEGMPHERIAQAARAKKADMVVIGTHGRTGFAKLVLGSVASRVLAISPCPVLTVRG
jgi:nucleotide-binding universal stress UspA family protein